jgi:acetyl esterase/lipase
VPIGYLITTGLMAAYVIFALRPPRPRRSSRFRLSFWLGAQVNELPFVAFYVLLASTALAIGQGDIDSPVGWTAFGLAVLATVGLPVLVRRAMRAGPVVDDALDAAGLAPRSRRRLPLARILFAPFPLRRRDVERVANLRYGEAPGRGNLLDLYRHRSHPAGCPTLIHLHGGAFVIGNKSREARPLIYRLASQGWVCISANYRLRGARFPDQLIDVKKVLAWVREHGAEYGADPSVVFVAGSSAGGHLASTAALTANDPVFQPGFERADTSVTAAISLYGYYGPIATRAGLPSSPTAYVRADAPPFFVAHGDLDTLVVVDDTRRFVERLRSTSSNPVVYAELPGGHHAFDLFHSIRFDTVVDGIEAFATWVTALTEPASRRR